MIPDAQSGACPRCGQIPVPSMGGAVACLRCAGEWAFSAGRDAPAAASRRIADYEIIEELGRGGMGCVYAARQIGLGRIVALKVVFTGLGSDAGLQMRFLREAQTLARLRHPHIVAVHDHGQAQGRTYLSMDYIEGGDLARSLRSGTFSPLKAAALAVKIAEALAYTHGMGVLHRDLKPSNILMDGEEPRVADFGLAAQLESGGELTVVTTLLGTPHYIAPEALKHGSHASTIASDIYSLGVVLFEMLTGRTPFAGASPVEFPGLVASVEPPSPRLLAPAVPKDLETICLKCIERDPVRRYGTATALAEDLQRFLDGRPIVARPVSKAEHFIRWCRRSPALAAVWVLLVLIAIGASTAAAWIARERSLAEVALRKAMISEARMARRTEEPGRRTRALEALAVAARIRKGNDLRDEALAALVTPDLVPVETWGIVSDQVVRWMSDPRGEVIAGEHVNAEGTVRLAAELHRWGHPEVFQRLDVPGTRVVGSLRFNLSGSHVMARYADQTLRVWRVGDAGSLLTLRRPMPTPQVLTSQFNDDYDFGPAGEWLALGLGDAGGFTLHRLKDGAETARWAGGPIVTTLRVSPDGHYVAAANGSVSRAPAHFFSVVETPDCRHVLTLSTSAPALELAWSSDSRLIAASLADRTIAVYDRRDGRLVQSLPRSGQDLNGISFAGRDQILIARVQGASVPVIPLATPNRAILLDGIGPWATSVDPSIDSFVLASLDGKLTRWRSVPPVGLFTIPVPRAAEYQYGFAGGAMDFSPDGRWVATGQRRFALIRDLERGRLAAEIDSGSQNKDDLTGVAFSSDGTALFCASGVVGLRRYALAPGADGGFTVGPAQLLDREAGFSIGARSADRRRLLLIDTDAGRVKVADVTADKAVILGAWDLPGAFAGAFSPDGSQILVNCSGQGPNSDRQKLSLFRTDGTRVKQLPAPVSCDVAWSADGGTALTSNGVHESVIWNTADWTPRVRLSGVLGGNVTTFALSPDGTRAAIQNGRSVHLVSTRDGSVLASIEIPEGSGFTEALRFAPDGRRFAVLWVDGRVDVIDPAPLKAELAKIGLAW